MSKSNQLPMNAIKLLEEQATNAMSRDLVRQLNESLLAALSKYLPGITTENFHSYTGRISRGRYDSHPGVERIYLDHGTADEKLVCEIGDVVVTVTDNKANVSQPITVY